jgi:hypothetical protein
MDQIVNFIAGPLFGLVGGAVSKWQDLEAKKEDNRHELKKFDFELQMRDKERIAKQEENEQAMALNQQTTEADLAKFVTEGSYAGLTESLKHDSGLKSGIAWIEGTRALVRPVLTFIGMGTLTYMCFATTGDLQEGAALSMYTNSSMMIAWWFGDRSAMKVNSRYVKN